MLALYRISCCLVSRPCTPYASPLAPPGTGTLPQVVEALLTCGSEQAAYLCGILWEATAEAKVAAAAQAAGAVPALLHVVSRNLLGCKMGERGSWRGGGGGGPPRGPCVLLPS